MSRAGGDDRGIPRGRRRLTPSTDEDWSTANEMKIDKLRRNSLQRLARARGLELRHSSYGYSLVDRARERLEGRSDLTLDEVESRLAAG